MKPLVFVPGNTALETVQCILKGRGEKPASSAKACAPVNIALVKYWGKRDEALHLPVTDSLSVSLSGLDTETEIHAGEKPDRLELDGRAITPEAPALSRLSAFLDLFRLSPAMGFSVRSHNAVPTAAGFASSASGFAALVRALDSLFSWHLERRELSLLARLGSGSACRSMYDGFVEWRAGSREDGLDSYAIPLPEVWPDLRIGLWTVSAEEKPLSSREAMHRTTQTSPLYSAWPQTVAADLLSLREALRARDIERFGQVLEGNALAMHATMLAARPSIFYPTADSLQAQARVRSARAAGTGVWFTMDAGPNLKLFFLERERPSVEAQFTGLRVVPTGASVAEERRSAR